MNNAILTTVGLSKYFGGLTALKKVDVTIRRGQIHSLIGPNGAGKTTFVNAVTTLSPASEGRCFFDGKDITNMKPYAVAKMGMSRTFQQGQIFPRMTCLQNVMIGRHKMDRSIFRTIFRPPFRSFSEEEKTEQKARELLQSVGMAEVADRWASDLNWVESQLLQIARARCSEPKLLILDEPTAGMGLDESETVERIIREVRETGVTVVLISHDLRLVMNVADFVTVLSFGEKIYEGTPAEARSDEKVLEAYLGE